MVQYGKRLVPQVSSSSYKGKATARQWSWQRVYKKKTDGKEEVLVEFLQTVRAR